MISVITFLFVMVVTAILFGSWVVFSIIRFIWRGIVGAQQPMVSTTKGRRCTNAGCRSGNPTHARFCRRCGSNLNETVQTPSMPLPQPRFNANNGRGRQWVSI